MYLLDVNVLIALADPLHVHSARTNRWFASIRGEAWATCPLVENEFLRIMGSPSYHESPGPPELIKSLLREIRKRPGHQFWADSVSLCDYADLPPSKHLTDFYLLALAVRHKGRLATHDRRIDPAAISGGEDAYCVILPETTSSSAVAGSGK